MKQRMINSIDFALQLRTMKSCLLGAPGCGKDRAKIVEMVEKMLSVAPTVEPESNLWWRDAKVELPPRHHTPCPRGNNPEYIIGALSESLHHFDVVNYTEDPPVRPYWGKYCGILKEDYYGCPICGYITNWQPEICPVCHTRLEMWDGKGKGA